MVCILDESKLKFLTKLCFTPSDIAIILSAFGYNNFLRLLTNILDNNDLWVIEEYLGLTASLIISLNLFFNIIFRKIDTGIFLTANKTSGEYYFIYFLILK